MEANATPACKTNRWILGLAGAILVGVVLRLVWIRDMEYKFDEAWTFGATQQVGRTLPFPWLGMPSSIGLDNPGMSCWVFLVLAKCFAVHEPPELARAVGLLNSAAILLLIAFVLRGLPRAEREPWLWAAAFLAVNPLAVLFHRKIWPPSILPIFLSVLLLAWWRRERRWGAFSWGLLGACLGQIHLGGFFFAAGFAAWALLFDRKRTAWPSWLLGSVLGSLTLLPWLHYVVTTWSERPIRHHNLVHVLECKFWMRWATEPLGFGLDYALEADFPDFLRFPAWHGQATFLVGILHGLALLVGVSIFLRAGWRGRQIRPRWSGLDLVRQSPTALTQNAALWGYGLLLTLSGMPIHRHYMIIAYPLEFLWLARLALGPYRDGGRILLATLCGVQLLLSVSFLSYVHVRQTIHGDYGVAYRSQQQPAVPADERKAFEGPAIGPASQSRGQDPAAPRDRGGPCWPLPQGPAPPPQGQKPAADAQRDQDRGNCRLVE